MRSGDWVIAVDGTTSFVARVGEIVHLFVPGEPVLRAALKEAREVQFEDASRGCVITVQRSQPATDMYACLESISLHEVYCDEESDPSVLTFNYIY